MRTLIAGSLAAAAALFFLPSVAQAATPGQFSQGTTSAQVPLSHGQDDPSNYPVHYPAPYPSQNPDGCSFAPHRLSYGEGVAAFCNYGPEIGYNSRPARGYRVIAECADETSHWFAYGPIARVGSQPSSAVCTSSPFGRARLIDYRIAWF